MYQIIRAGKLSTAKISFFFFHAADGVTYSYGLFIPQIKTYFKSSTEDASWVLALLTGVTFCSGESDKVYNTYL